jgi:hypothetical protein
MSKLMAGIALAAVMATSAWADDSSKLVGVWKLTSWTRHEMASGKDVKLYGEHPGGSIVLTKGGRFVSSGFVEGRAKPAAANPTDEERIALFKTMYAYEGTYKVEGGKIIQSVENAWNQGWVGTEFNLAKYEVSDKTLTLVSAPFKAVMDGVEITVTTTYDRVE